MGQPNSGPRTRGPSSSYCSRPCPECPVLRLIPEVQRDTATIVEAVLTVHTAAEVREAPPQTLGHWIEENDFFLEEALFGFPVEHDIAFYALRRVAKGECPQHLVI